MSGEIYRGEDGLIMLRETDPPSDVGEIPCLTGWTLESSASLNERNNRCMKSNGDNGYGGGTNATLTIPKVGGGNAMTITAVGTGNAMNSYRVGFSINRNPGITNANISGVTISGTTFVVIINAALPSGSPPGPWGLAYDITAAELAAALLSNSVFAASFAITNITGNVDYVGNASWGGYPSIPFTGGSDDSFQNWSTQTLEGKSFTLDLEFFWQEDEAIPASSRIDIDHIGTSISFILYPYSEAVSYVGTAIIESVSTNGEVNGDVNCSVTLKGVGAVQKVEV